MYTSVVFSAILQIAGASLEQEDAFRAIVLACSILLVWNGGGRICLAGNHWPWSPPPIGRHLHLLPSSASLLISVYPARATQPHSVPARHRAALPIGPVPPQSLSARPRHQPRHRSEDIKRSPRSTVGCQRQGRREAFNRSRYILLGRQCFDNHPGEGGETILKEQLDGGVDDGQHAVPRSPRRPHGELQSRQNKQKLGEIWHPVQHSLVPGASCAFSEHCAELLLHTLFYGRLLSYVLLGWLTGQHYTDWGLPQVVRRRSISNALQRLSTDCFLEAISILKSQDL